MSEEEIEKRSKALTDITRKVLGEDEVFTIYEGLSQLFKKYDD